MRYTNQPDSLVYDQRPVVTYRNDNVVADTRAADSSVASSSNNVLKPWILPTANEFISDSSKWHKRPAGKPGIDFPFVQSKYKDDHWQLLNLPHDWAIAGPFLKDGPYGGMGRLRTWGPAWYRRTLDIPAGDAGRSIFLDVDGAMSYATVWLNEQLVGGWPYGYASWRLDLTPYAMPGRRNVLVIRLDNPPESARWYPGAGLYRNVWLTKSVPPGSRITQADLRPS